ncbi:ribonuclease P protein component [Palleronia marisminoris]|uniref:Ribonuclease P protein component n=1 Tax=Palleronia marisminoris TaxID=315423 RepID=A0A1Y5T7I4_9RHOB|nr:ribonuclease P protein component [Palleronia marisminoris]SFH16923.1 ribonuclease P protein component [Palleronia marisminoris]SLN55755.1 Ribonuclease P protein component [Palleronia marisminoris]
MTDNQPAAPAPGGSLPLERLKQRADFLRAARARVVRASSFMLQARDREEDGPVRVGFTCSKKVGNAVARNRAKRRLREVARLDLPALARPGWDYVLIGRRDATATTDFAELRTEFARAVEKAHR